MNPRKLWVDPEGVSAVGRDYERAAEVYRQYLRQLQALRTQYYGSWGNDELGQKFSAKFLEGLDAMDGIVGNVADSLAYAGEGLTQSGRSYRLADDDAQDAGLQLKKAFEPGPGGGGPPPPPAPGQEQPGQPLLRARTLARRVAPITEQAPGLTVENGQIRPEADSNFTNLPQYARARTTEGVMSSATRMNVNWQNATIDGKPLADGYELIEAGRLPDGNVRLDSNFYAEITPVTSEYTMLDGNGNPIQGDNFFIVKRQDNPEAGTDGYEPNYVDFGPDGTAVPYVTNVEPPDRSPGMLSSSMSLSLDYAGASINGSPIADGYYILGANEITDGTVRLDTNYYSSITPIDPSYAITSADGQPLPGEPGRQLFLVRDVPQEQRPDGLNPGYQPNYIDFGAGGTVSRPVVPA